MIEILSNLLGKVIEQRDYDHPMVKIRGTVRAIYRTDEIYMLVEQDTPMPPSGFAPRTYEREPGDIVTVRLSRGPVRIVYWCNLCCGWIPRVDSGHPRSADHLQAVKDLRTLGELPPDAP